MQEKDKYLKKINYIILVIILIVSNNLFATNIKSKLLDYNYKLKNSSALFIQTNGKTVEEGIIYVGSERVKIDYKKPTKISIIISEKKSMYVNHALKETQFFDTNKTFIQVFFKILTGKDIYEDSNFEITESKIVISNDFKINKKSYKTKIIYENKPIKIRKIEVEEAEGGFEIGFFNHNNFEAASNKEFLLINPYLN